MSKLWEASSGCGGPGREDGAVTGPGGWQGPSGWGRVGTSNWQQLLGSVRERRSLHSEPDTQLLTQEDWLQSGRGCLTSVSRPPLSHTGAEPTQTKPQQGHWFTDISLGCKHCLRDHLQRKLLESSMC